MERRSREGLVGRWWTRSSRIWRGAWLERVDGRAARFERQREAALRHAAGHESPGGRAARRERRRCGADVQMRVPGGACRSGVGVVLDGSDIGACWSGATPAHLQHTSSTPPALVSTPPPPSCWSVLALCQHHSNTTPPPHQHHINTAPSHTRCCSHDIARPKSEDPVRQPCQDAIPSGIRNFD